MAGFDTTDIAAKVDPHPIDAIKTLSGIADLNNAQNQNKFFQAKNLAGQYLEQSLGPDGQTDFNKLGEYLKNDTRTGPFALELLQGAKVLEFRLQPINKHFQKLSMMLPEELQLQPAIRVLLPTQ